MEPEFQVLLPGLLLLSCVPHDESLPADPGEGESMEAWNVFSARVSGDGTHYDGHHKGLAVSVVPGGMNGRLSSQSLH